MLDKESEIKVYPENGDYYRHYKGGTYRVISMCKHSETGEDLVIYESITFGGVYARPLELWFEHVETPSGMTPRFWLIPHSASLNGRKYLWEHFVGKTCSEGDEIAYYNKAGVQYSYTPPTVKS